MAEARKADQQPDEAEQKKAAEEAAEEEAKKNVAVNPVDLGTDVDDLPTVPGAGQFMPPEDATEETAPVPGTEGGGEARRGASGEEARGGAQQQKKG